MLTCHMTTADDDNDAVLFEKIKSGNYDADDPIWENISAEAKDVVAKLLTVRGCLINCISKQHSFSVM